MSEAKLSQIFLHFSAISHSCYFYDGVNVLGRSDVRRTSIRDEQTNDCPTNEDDFFAQVSKGYCYADNLSNIVLICLSHKARPRLAELVTGLTNQLGNYTDGRWKDTTDPAGKPVVTKVDKMALLSTLVTTIPRCLISRP